MREFREQLAESLLKGPQPPGHEDHDMHYAINGEHVTFECACGKSWMITVT